MVLAFGGDPGPSGTKRVCRIGSDGVPLEAPQVLARLDHLDSAPYSRGKGLSAFIQKERKDRTCLYFAILRIEGQESIADGTDVGYHHASSSFALQEEEVLRWYENEIWGGGDIARALLSDPAISGRSPQVVCASALGIGQDGTELNAFRLSAHHHPSLFPPDLMDDIRWADSPENNP